MSRLGELHNLLVKYRRWWLWPVVGVVLAIAIVVWLVSRGPVIPLEYEIF